MPNDSRSRAGRRGEPGLIPRRGAAALLVTGGSLALLLSFRTPEPDPFGADSPLLAPATPVAWHWSPRRTRPPPTAPPSAAAEPSAVPTPRVVLGPPAPDDLAGRAPTPAPTRRPSATPPPAPDVTSAPTPATAVARQVVDGKVVRTPYGDVQVEVTIKNGTLVDVQALQLPDGDRHSRRISQIVGPMLHDDALQVGSARIHGVSGATYTSIGYARSLQSALDQAGA